MLAENILDRIGLSAEYKEQYFHYSGILGNILEPYAAEYMQSTLPIWDYFQKIHAITDVHPYTVDFMFVLACTGYLEEKWKSMGISNEIFENSMKDILYKLEECIQIKKIFGLFVGSWYGAFFHDNLMALGRFQYRMRHLPLQEGESLNICGKTYTAEDKIVDFHIPSSGPMTREACMDSFRRAYDMFSEQRIGGVLPMFCGSWLLYPDYEEVFSASPNILAFRNDFTIFDVHSQEHFSDSWRVFGTDETDIEKLPERTSMQRNFKTYMKHHTCFGSGCGIVLFDGEKVIKDNIYKI